MLLSTPTHNLGNYYSNAIDWYHNVDIIYCKSYTKSYKHIHECMHSMHVLQDPVWRVSGAGKWLHSIIEISNRSDNVKWIDNYIYNSLYQDIKMPQHTISWNMGLYFLTVGCSIDWVQTRVLCVRNALTWPITPPLSTFNGIHSN